jgi:hypothetical protein
MAASPAGDVFCVWLDLRNKGTQLYGSRSTDGGATWSKNTLVYKSPGGSICECCHPSVAYDAQGALHAMWRNSLSGNRDMYLATSKDGGDTFGTAVKLGTGAWELDACPMDGGAIAITASGRIATAWRRDKDVFLTADTPSSEQKLGTGLQPWLAAGRLGLYTVWLAERPGVLFLASPDSDRPLKLADRARDPVVAGAPDGSGPVAVAWEEDSGRSAIKVWISVSDVK